MRTHLRLCIFTLLTVLVAASGTQAEDEDDCVLVDESEFELESQDDIAGYSVAWKAAIENSCPNDFEVHLTLRALDRNGKSMFSALDSKRVRGDTDKSITGEFYVPNHVAERLESVEVDVQGSFQ